MNRFDYWLQKTEWRLPQNQNIERDFDVFGAKVRNVSEQFIWNKNFFFQEMASLMRRNSSGLLMVWEWKWAKEKSLWFSRWDSPIISKTCHEIVKTTKDSNIVRKSSMRNVASPNLVSNPKAENLAVCENPVQGLASYLGYVSVWVYVCVSFAKTLYFRHFRLWTRTATGRSPSQSSQITSWISWQTKLERRGPPI